MLLYSGHYFPAWASASDWLLGRVYHNSISVSSTDSASHSGKKLCCYTQGTTSQPQAQPQTGLGKYTTTVSSVSSTDSASHSGKNICCYTQGTLPSLRPQTMVVGQSIPQQYPQSPAQTVPPTQVRNYVGAASAEYTTTVSSVSSTDSASHSGKKLCCYTQGTGLSPNSLLQQVPSLRPWLLGILCHNNHGLRLTGLGLGSMLLYSGHYFPAPASDHGCWAEYTTTVSSVSSTDSASHSGKKLLLFYTLPSLSPRPSLRPWLLGIPQQYPQSPAQTVPPTQVRNYVVILRGGYCPSLSWSLRPWLLGRVYHNSILSLQHRQCLPLR